MNRLERGFLLLTSHLGCPDRRVLTPPQMRILADRIRQMHPMNPDRDVCEQDLILLGYNRQMAGRIVALLSEEELLDAYVRRAASRGCIPITRVSTGYPLRLRKALGLDAPGCLWAKGDLRLLECRGIGLVGSRDLRPGNAAFASRVGLEAAQQGYILISGNARGADKVGQSACLRAGGGVISIVADELDRQNPGRGQLYLSEDDYGEPFSTIRALSRNRCIHAMAEKLFVAQCSDGTGGTWDGTVKNLHFLWSPVFVFDDGSDVMSKLQQMGGEKVGIPDLKDISALKSREISLFSE